LAIKVGFISFAAVLLTVVFPARGTEVSSASALHGEAIPLIDAHSQVDCLVSKDLVMRQLERLRISRVLISVRGCRGWTTEQLEGRTLDWSKEHPDRISALVSTKVDGWSYASLSSGEVEALGPRAHRLGFVGMGEVLVQHAAHEHAQLSYPELALRLDDVRIQKAIEVARGKNWPVILHIELNDNEEAAAQTLADLGAMLTRNADVQFGLIHMAQASAREARSLLEKYSNVFFLTTKADNSAAGATKKSLKKGVVAQTGWINMFRGQCELKDCPSEWKPEWKKLIVEYPNHFVLAFENVFPQHWEEPYAIKVGIWRRALAMLPAEVAHAVAHRNAERLWKLPAAK
jgi:hypothetical protein